MKPAIRMIATSIVLAVTTTAFAHDGVENAATDARMHAMHVIGGSMKTIGGMAQGQMDFDAAGAKAALDAIAEQAEMLPTLFEPNETDPKSKAQPAIWTNFDDFVAKAGALQLAAEAGDATSAATLGQAMGGLGGACRACHMAYKSN